ncbi:hypothetical protein [Pontibacter sp. Tf4]|nr:hypothetical protein [Pontibacter sp. Tf4]
MKGTFRDGKDYSWCHSFLPDYTTYSLFAALQSGCCHEIKNYSFTSVIS